MPKKAKPARRMFAARSKPVMGRYRGALTERSAERRVKASASRTSSSTELDAGVGDKKEAVTEALVRHE